MPSSAIIISSYACVAKRHPMCASRLRTTIIPISFVPSLETMDSVFQKCTKNVSIQSKDPK